MGETRGEDFTVASDSFYMCLTDCYDRMVDTVDVAFVEADVRTEADICLHKNKTRKVTEGEGEVKITPVIMVTFPEGIARGSGLGEDKLTLHFDLLKCHLMDPRSELAFAAVSVVLVSIPFSFLNKQMS